MEIILLLGQRSQSHMTTKTPHLPSGAALSAGRSPHRGLRILAAQILGEDGSKKGGLLGLRDEHRTQILSRILEVQEEVVLWHNRFELLVFVKTCQNCFARHR